MGVVGLTVNATEGNDALECRVFDLCEIGSVATEHSHCRREQCCAV